MSSAQQANLRVGAMYRVWGKRVLDLTMTTPVLVALSPLIALIALLVRITFGTPVIFSQERSGLQGVPFRLLKFRTMTNEVDGSGCLLPDAERLTSFGRLLRETSLDELPSLVNVMRGELSLVGPRPLLTKYLTRYTAEQARRHEVRPGVTGLAQVSGRNALTWDEKFSLDREYAENVGLKLDLLILVRTLRRVVTREGVNQQGEATAAEFWGTDIDHPGMVGGATSKLLDCNSGSSSMN